MELPLKKLLQTGKHRLYDNCHNSNFKEDHLGWKNFILNGKRYFCFGIQFFEISDIF